MRPSKLMIVIVCAIAACGGSDDVDLGANVDPNGQTTYGSAFEGGLFHLGPVDYDETKFHNACAPAEKYPSSVRDSEGTLLAGLWDGIPNVAGFCDACILVTTKAGKSSLLRVVTYGGTSTNSIDVSPEAFNVLNSGEDPRAMTWSFAKCPDTGKIVYQFQTGSNEDYTSLWVRNARVPLTKVEVMSVKHSAFVELQLGGDGTRNDYSGFGKGDFTLRLTGADGKTVTDKFSWPSSGIAGKLLTGAGNFD